MAETYVREHGTTAHTVTARRNRRCDGDLCWNLIKRGEDYVRCVVFPGHDANNSRAPWVLRICQPCRTKSGRPMPPRHRRKENRRG